MTWKGFLLGFLILVSIDVFVGFLIWLLYKYIDMKYLSEFKITTLQEENDFLKRENRKVNGSTKFWEKDDIL